MKELISNHDTSTMSHVMDTMSRASSDNGGSHIKNTHTSTSRAHVKTTPRTSTSTISDEFTYIESTSTDEADTSLPSTSPTESSKPDYCPYPGVDAKYCGGVDSPKKQGIIVGTISLILLIVCLVLWVVLLRRKRKADSERAEFDRAGLQPNHGQFGTYGGEREAEYQQEEMRYAAEPEPEYQEDMPGVAEPEAQYQEG